MNHFADTKTLFDQGDVSFATQTDIEASRLRQRLAICNGEAVLDDEILELILARVVPTQDIGPLVHRLLSHFGDINAVLSAPRHALAQVLGMSDAIATELKIVEIAAQRLARAKIMHRPVVSSWTELIDYCHTMMAHKDIEQFRILFLNTKNILIADEEQAKGSIDHAPVYPREVVKRALDLNASAVILVHNHPSGDPTPSLADIEMTQQIARAANALNIDVHDHLIIGKSREVSLKALELL